ncbi:MAG: tetratricopeptide repeat protein [Anaerolineae bacterium]|nr:tetratricopeptide repeat protein [Anaerolineae bacterium]
MAVLKVLEEQPTRLVLGKGGGAGIGSLIGIIIFGIVTLVGLTAVFDEGGGFNPVALVIVLLVALAGLGQFINSIASTRVTLDAGQKIAARTDSLLFVPTRQQSLPFNLIRDVEVTSSRVRGAQGLDSAPIWRVVLRGADGSKLIVNDRGTRADMQMLAEQVGTLVARPIKSTPKPTQQARAATATYTPAGVPSELAQNLGVFAESFGAAGAATVAPTVSAFPVESSRMRDDAAEQLSVGSPFAQASARMTAQQVAAGAERAATNAQMAADRAAAFSSDTPIQARMSAEQVAAGAAFTEASARLAEQQAQAQAVMGVSMPALMTMPPMPPMMSMGPALSMPSFVPIGVSFELMAMPLPMAQETKYVELQESEPVSDNAPLFVQAQKLLGAHNYRDAEQAFLRALKTNPADATGQNDLGVVYYVENKLHDAESAFRRAMALDPFHLQARYNLGLVLDRLGRRAEAKEVFRVGAQTAGRDKSKHFQEALRGTLHDPMTSSG